MRRVYFTNLLLVTILIGVNALTGLAQVDSVNKIQEIKVISLKIPSTIGPAQEINANSFKKYSAYHVADAIKNFAGVNVKDYGGIGGLKTVSVRSLGANHTAVLLDGIVVNDAQNGQIDLGRLSLDNIESIALYNAQLTDLPQSARSYASASLLSIKTIQPSFDSLKRYNLSVGFTAGSFGLIHPTIQWQQKISSNWFSKINTYWQTANGKYKYQVDDDGSDTLAVRDNADLSIFQFDAAVYGKFSKYNKIYIRANYYDSERGLPGAIISYNDFSLQRLWNKDFFIQATFEQDFNDKLRMKLDHKTSKNHTQYIDPLFLNQDGGLDEKFDQQEVYQSAAFHYQLHPQFSLDYAADIAITDLKTNLPQYVYPQRLSLLQVLGARFNYKKWKANINYLNTNITEKVKVGESSPSRSVYTPTVMLSYQPKESQDLIFRTFYKEIFRYPSFSDLYYTNFGNRSLDPEFVKQINLGSSYKKAFANKWSYVSLTADVYFNQVKDKIIAVPRRDLFLWTVRNIGSVDIYGLDAVLSTEYEINSKWKASFSGNYTYQLALDVSDKNSSLYNSQLPYTPKHTANANLGFKTNLIGFYYNHLFSSGRYYLSDNSPEYFVPGFSVSDFSVVSQFYINKKSITSAIEINNLFNKSYSIIRSFPMPGTSVRISLKTNL